MGGSIVLPMLLDHLIEEDLISSLQNVFWNHHLIAGVWIITLGLIQLGLQFLVAHIFGMELFQDFVQMLLVWCGITVEIAGIVLLIFILVLIKVENWGFFGFLVADVFETTKSSLRRVINVHILDFRLLDLSNESLSVHKLLLEHLHFFLIFLNAHVETMKQNISINNSLFCKSVRSLFCS